MLSIYRRLLSSLPRAFINKGKTIVPQRALSTGPNDQNDRDPNYTLQPSQETEKVIQEASELQQRIRGYSKLDLDFQSTLQMRLKMEWTYHSNAIEGSTLTLGETIFFLKEGLTVSGKPLKDFLDAKNHAEALDYLYDMVSSEQERITPGFIRELNKILLSGITQTPAVTLEGKRVMKPATPGQYKKMPNHVLQADGTIHRYVEPSLVDEQIVQMCDWINNNLSRQHPIITAAVAHYNQVRIHPFDDGNGRGSRLLMNLILLKERYYPAIIRREDRKEYVSALKEADDGNLNPFTQFVGKSLIYTQKLVCSEIEKLYPPNASTPKRRM